MTQCNYTSHLPNSCWPVHAAKPCEISSIVQKLCDCPGCLAADHDCISQTDKADIGMRQHNSSMYAPDPTLHDWLVACLKPASSATTPPSTGPRKLPICDAACKASHKLTQVVSNNPGAQPKQKISLKCLLYLSVFIIAEHTKLNGQQVG